MGSSKLVVFCSFLTTLLLLLAFQGAARELLDVASKINRQLREDFPWGHGYIVHDSKP